MSGWKIIKGAFHPCQVPFNITQRHLSHQRSFGLGVCRLRTRIWWRSARTSKASWCLERNEHDRKLRSAEIIANMADQFAHKTNKINGLVQRRSFRHPQAISDSCRRGRVRIATLRSNWPLH